jgi:hypothetical protein
MRTVVVAVVPRSAIRPADIVKATAACGHAPLFVIAAGAMDPEEKAEYAGFGPVVECEEDRTGDAVELLRSHGPSAITAFSEAMVATTAELADGLGLPFHDRDTATALTDKWLQRRRLAEHGVDAVWSVVVTSRREALDTVERRPGPMVLKPKRSQSSRDTYLVTDPDGIPVELAISAGRPFVLEEFLPGRDEKEFGDYVSVESLVVDDEPFTLGVTGKLPLVTPFREQGQFVPSHLPARELTEIAELASAAARALGIRRGLVHTEIKLTPGGPRIIEVNGRVGGFINELYQRATGQDLLELGMAVACGLPVDPRAADSSGPVHFQFNNLPPLTGGVLLEIEGVEKVRREPGLAGYTSRVPVGTKLDPGVMTFLLDQLRGTVPDHRAMLETIDRCVAHLRFTFEQPGGAVGRWQAARDGLYLTTDGR